MKLTPMQQYMVLGLCAFLGIGFLYYQFLLKPVNKQIVALQVKLDQEKKDLESAKQIVAKYSEFKKSADSVQRELEWIENRIPKTIDRSKFLEAINFVQTRSGVVLTSFQFGNSPKSKESYTEVPATLKFSTDYQGLLSFLNQVGGLPCS